MRAIITSAAIAFLSASVCNAHQDALIEIRKDGKFIGLPKEFEPASIQIEFSKPGSGHPIKSVTIILGGNSVKFPTKIVRMLRSKSIDALQASASWYHDEIRLPFYMRIDFLEPGFNKQRIDNSGMTFLVNLRTGKVMRIGKVVITKPGQSWEERFINPEQLCSPEELKEFYAPLPIDRWRKQAAQPA